MGEVADVIGGGTPKTQEITYWNGSINWFTPSEIGNDTFVSESERKITQEGLENSSAKLLPVNKTVLFTSRATIGEMAIPTVDATTNQGFQNLVPTSKMKIYFLYSLKNKIKKETYRYATGSTFKEISNKNVKNISISLPEIKEQEKISSLFKSLDNLITLYTKKSNSAENLKEFLLDNMFV